jgi:dTDP-4-dehydrorhamnose reductase
MSGPSPTFLLIGAGGLVGRHVRAALAGRSLISTYHREPEDGGLVLDITESDDVRRTIRDSRPDVIVLAAAEAWVERCEREPDATRRLNVDAARVIAEEATRAGALLVVFSSEYVFDGTAGRYVESDERHPINEYGRQKVQLEDLALGTGRALVCRTSAVFGHEPRRKNFVYQLVDRLREGRVFVVPSDQLITPTYAPSLARTVVELIDGGTTGVVHTAGPRILDRLAFSRIAAATFGLPATLLAPRLTSELGLSAPRPLRCGLSVELVRTHLGRPLTDPEAALHELAMGGTW